MNLEIDPTGRFAGYWVELVYAASYFCDPVRPVLHFELGDGREERATLPAPVCGRAIWRGKIPAGAKTWIDPGPGLSEAQFRVESITAIGLSSLAIRAARSPRIGIAGVLQHALGMREGARRKIAATLQDEQIAAYDRWRAARVRQPDLTGLDRLPDELENAPSLLLQGLDGTAAGWSETVKSLQAQICPSWRLRITASSDEVYDVLKASTALRGEARVQVGRGDGESDENIAATLALTAGDRLPCEAVAVLLSTFLREPAVAILSFDEDEPVGPKARRPILRPCKTRDAFHPASRTAVRTGSRTEYGAPGSIRHIARVLLHRVDPARSQGPERSSRRAVRTMTSQDRPSVDIVIPTRDRADMLKRCMTAILKRADYPSLRVIIADNDTVEPEAVRYLQTLRRMPHVTVMSAPGKFNFAAICNRAAALGSGKVIIFMNNDVEAKGARWLDALVSRAMAPDIGAVGAKLLYPSGAVQHAGIVLGLHGAAGHIYRGAGRRDLGYEGRLSTDQIVSAVTGACLAVERRKFEEVGGFDEANYPVEFNDVDLCLRLGRKNYACLWTPAAELVHFESASRGRFILPGGRRGRDDRRRFQQSWAAEVANDPCFHPAFSLTLEIPRLG